MKAGPHGPAFVPGARREPSWWSCSAACEPSGSGPRCPAARRSQTSLTPGPRRQRLAATGGVAWEPRTSPWTARPRPSARGSSVGEAWEPRPPRGPMRPHPSGCGSSAGVAWAHRPPPRGQRPRPSGRGSSADAAWAPRSPLRSARQQSPGRRDPRHSGRARPGWPDRPPRRCTRDPLQARRRAG